MHHSKHGNNDSLAKSTTAMLLKQSHSWGGIVGEKHCPNDNHYRNLLAMGLWVVARHGVVRTDFLVLGFVPEDSYSCQIVI